MFINICLNTQTTCYDCSIIHYYYYYYGNISALAALGPWHIILVKLKNLMS